MARTNLETLSPKELETALEQARARERAEVKAKLIALAEQLGFSEGEILSGGDAPMLKKSPTTRAAKYANPSNRNQTWSGRGRRPRWLTSEMKKGRKLKDFVI